MRLSYPVNPSLDVELGPREVENTLTPGEDKLTVFLLAQCSFPLLALLFSVLLQGRTPAVVLDAVVPSPDILQGSQPVSP